MIEVNTAINALKDKKRLQLIYKGHLRKIEVHSIGVGTKGNTSMLVYQVEGGSNSAEQQGWKLLNLGEASSITILDEASEAPRSGYKGGVRGMIEIFAQVLLPPEADAQGDAVAH